MPYNNIIVSVLLSALTITEWGGCRISNDKVDPISVYSLPSSKFQVKDVLDSIVYQDSSFVFRELTNYIDTFILDRSFCLAHVINSDSIGYFYYFSGDVKEWFTNVDSTLLILSHLSVNGNTYDSKLIKTLPREKMKNILNYFNQKIVDKVIGRISGLNRYDIRIIDTVKRGRIEGEGVICKQPGQCDTLLLKYIDGGKYTGIVRVLGNY